MDRFRSIQVFVKVAECNGFAAAARSLDMSPPAVTRAVSMLEDQLGTRLFVRTTRTIRLTESGRRFLVDAKRILLDLEEAENAAIGSHAKPRGELTITAPALFGRMFVTPVLSQFLREHSQLTATTLYVDRVVNMLDEGVDVAVRIGELPDSTLVALRCGSVSQVLVAAPEYLKENGTPKTPADLAKHTLIQPIAISTSQEWAFQINGAVKNVSINPRIRMNTNDAVIEMATRATGISRLLSYQVAPYISDGQLQPILQTYQLPPSPIHVVHQEGRMVSAKVRSFVDFATNQFRTDPHLN